MNLADYAGSINDLNDSSEQKGRLYKYAEHNYLIQDSYIEEMSKVSDKLAAWNVQEADFPLKGDLFDLMKALLKYAILLLLDPTLRLGSAQSEIMRYP